MTPKRQKRRRPRVKRGRGPPKVNKGKIYIGKGVRRPVTYRQRGSGGLSRFIAGLLAKIGEAIGV